MTKIGIVVFNNVEELDFIGPYETLSYINKLQPQSVQVMLLSESLPLVRGYNGLTFQVDHVLAEAPNLDVIILPGGQGRHQAMYNPQIRHFLLTQAKHAQYICSVCTGAFILAEAGLLAGLQATTHYTALQELKTSYPNIQVLEKRVVDNGKIMLAAGISSGIDLSLLLVKKLYNREMAKSIAQRLEYQPLINL